MDARELRIGNLVNIGYDCKVVRIEEYGATLNTYNGVKEFIHFHQTDIRPIPLTEERLLKIGFSLSYKSEYKRKFDLDINTEFGYDFDLNGNVNGMQGFRHYGRYYTCEYLHQLQNLYFALTGLELTLPSPQQQQD